MHISSELVEQILAFSRERDWEQFHNPKDLAISISMEAAELLADFQWTGSDLQGKNPENIREELADVMIYCILMADSVHADIGEIIQKKLETDDRKYPVSKAKGNAKKYTELS